MASSDHNIQKILIIGGGIGGLTAAVALRQAGFYVEVAERSPEIREVGAAICCASNATRVLNDLGLGERLAEVSVPVTMGDMLSWRGPTLNAVPMIPLAEKFGALSTIIHRATLQGLLLEAFGSESIHLNHACTGVEVVDGKPVAHFDNGNSIQADVIIGADGLYSAVRKSLHGDTPPRYAGYACWRGLTEPFEHPDFPRGTLREIQGPGARMGICYHEPERVYWWATADSAPGVTYAPDEQHALLLRILDGWPSPTKELLEATKPENIICNDIYDRDPIFPWGQGPITLLGDAAHPMEPNLGQGACSAIEDAGVLGRTMKRLAHDPEKALRTYEELRYERTRHLQLLSRRFGKLGQTSSPLACRLRETVIHLTPKSYFLKHVEDVMGYRFEDAQ